MTIEKKNTSKRNTIKTVVVTVIFVLVLLFAYQTIVPIDR